ILHYSTFDFWFESDPPAFLDQMESRMADHHFRTRRHPLWSLVVYPIVQAVAWIFSLSIEHAIVVVMALAAAAWAGVIFVILRLMGLQRAVVSLFTALATVSAAAVFWLPVPETYTLGALSIVVAVAMVVLTDRKVKVPQWALFLTSVGTL